jgi:MFS family permease
VIAECREHVSRCRVAKLQGAVGFLHLGPRLRAALAPSLPALIVFRIGQAVSGALVFPNGAGLLRAVVPAVRRGRAFGSLGAVVGSAAAVGPIVGGIALTIGGWRVCES